MHISIKKALILLLALVVSLSLYIAYSIHYISSKTAAVIIIPKGYSVNAIATILSQRSIIHNRYVFILLSKILQLYSNTRLIAGEYQFIPGMSIAQILQKITQGDVIVHKITIPEGYTSYAVIAKLQQAYGIVCNADIEIPSEGSLLPETYLYTYGQLAPDILKQMTTAMDNFLEKAWQDRDSCTHDVLHNKHAVLVLASIVEKETSINEERPRIAAVYLNRLRKNMPLQADPTIVYALTYGRDTLDRRLTFNDLQVRSKYNTHKNVGIPPTAICNPGKASIEAVLHPAASDELYFVANGHGGHNFASTFSKHLKNVKIYRAIQYQAAPMRAK